MVNSKLRSRAPGKILPFPSRAEGLFQSKSKEGQQSKGRAAVQGRAERVSVRDLRRAAPVLRLEKKAGSNQGWHLKAGGRLLW